MLRWNLNPFFPISSWKIVRGWDNYATEVGSSYYCLIRKFTPKNLLRLYTISLRQHGCNYLTSISYFLIKSFRFIKQNEKHEVYFQSFSVPASNFCMILPINMLFCTFILLSSMNDACIHLACVSTMGAYIT